MLSSNKYKHIPHTAFKFQIPGFTPRINCRLKISKARNQIFIPQLSHNTDVVVPIKLFGRSSKLACLRSGDSLIMIMTLRPVY